MTSYNRQILKNMQHFFKYLERFNTLAFVKLMLSKSKNLSSYIFIYNLWFLYPASQFKLCIYLLMPKHPCVRCSALKSSADCSNCCWSRLLPLSWLCRRWWKCDWIDAHWFVWMNHVYGGRLHRADFVCILRKIACH